MTHRHDREAYSLRVPLHTNGFDHCTSLRDDVAQSIRMLLTTRPGSRILRPEYGCRIQELMFRPLVPSVLAAMEFFVRAAITVWEPRARDVVVKVTGVADIARSERALVEVSFVVERGRSEVLRFSIESGVIFALEEARERDILQSSIWSGHEQE